MRLFIFFLLLLFCFSLEAQSLSWAKSFGRGDSPLINNAIKKALARDASGNVYTTGSFTSGAGGIDFDPGVGVFNLTSGGGTDVFISKLDANGNFVWALRIGGTGTQVGEHIALDVAGNIYIAGTFDSTPDFNPGVGVFNITSSGSLDYFIVKLDLAGNFLWAKSIGGSYGTSDNIINSLTVDAVGNIYFTGAINGGGQSFDFDPNIGTFLLTLPITAAYNIYTAKWDANGNFVWAKQLTASIGLNCVGNDIQLDALGNIFIVGNFSEMLDFDPGVGVFSMGVAGSLRAFLWVLNNGGNFIAAREFGGSGPTERVLAKSFNFDVFNNMYLTGIFTGTADFDPNAGIFNLTSPSGSTLSLYVVKLSPIGILLWAKAVHVIPGLIDGVYDGVSSVSDCGVLVTGIFVGTADFDPSIGVFNLPPGIFTPYILQLDPNGNFIYAIKPNVTFKSPLDIDAFGNMYGIGTFSNTQDFDLNPNAVFNLTAPVEGNATFVTKLLPFPWAPSVISPLSACLNSTDTISASTVLGSSLSWYSEVTGGTFLGTGNSLITPVLTDTTTFYVQDSTCQAGPRDSITVNTISCIPLPITLLSFNAYLHNEAVQTEWVTTTEINNDYFTIERSTDAIHFDPIGTKKGAGNSNAMLNYEFLDQLSTFNFSLSTVLYYRLKQTDFNGNYEYFDVKAVYIEKNTSLDYLEVYPNPTTGEFFISWNDKLTNEIVIQLTDNLGKEIYTTFITQENRIQLKMNNELPKGIYFLNIQTNQTTVVKKIIKN